jgi:AcrR family transcriptional regulator
MADAPGTDGEASTRERILAIALDLFTVQGYDKTSLRQIAEKLGFSKAAIYYHFASKGEILLALHSRFHEVGLSAINSMDESDWTLEGWAKILDGLIDQILEHRVLIILHDRNRAALEELHGHDADHDDLETRLQEILSTTRIPLRDRVRMAAAFGSVLGALVFTGNAFADVPPDELAVMLRQVVADLLTPS